MEIEIKEMSVIKTDRDMDQPNSGTIPGLGVGCLGVGGVACLGGIGAVCWGPGPSGFICGLWC